MQTINLDVATKVLSTIDAGLVSGVGNPTPGEMCVEAAVCFALGLPHGDDPICVSKALRAFKIGLNDADWSSPQARAAGLRRLGLAQLGSSAGFDDQDFAKRLAKMTIGVILPRALRNVAKLCPKHADSLETAAKLCEAEPTEKSARAAANAFYAARAAANAFYAARAAARAADAARAAARAADAARTADAADAVVYAADAAVYAADAFYAAPQDTELAFMAEHVVQILIDMDAPGCQWLYLAPL